MPSPTKTPTPPPQVFIIAGPNGAGKSTLAPYLLRDAFGVGEFVNADTIALGLSAFSPESVTFAAGRIMLARLADLARARQSFAFETTLATRSYAAFVARLRREEGYEFQLLYLTLRSPELAVERVRSRVRLGGHTVPAAVVHRRFLSSARNFLRLYRPLADTWGMYDNSTLDAPCPVAVGHRDEFTKVLQPDLWHEFQRRSL
ncbi:MAG TPA: zeta toxin family protein [Pyrinomonadaceae bacterium]|nr:zeta toxin family protein [Pyrinomonadaceae bacterium]